MCHALTTRGHACRLMDRRTVRVRELTAFGHRYETSFCHRHADQLRDNGSIRIWTDRPGRLRDGAIWVGDARYFPSEVAYRSYDEQGRMIGDPDAE